MNRAEESAFVWALMDSAEAFLTKRVRAWLCVRIGAGELDAAIRELLHGFLTSNTAMPAALGAPLWAWVGGFAGSDGEAGLRELASRIRLFSNYAESNEHPKSILPPSVVTTR
ncbi:hypothetical protein A5792_25555 [Mycolicibacterium peregrinum]|uniref:Uncharacterized protein n=1 Tax=Mycolicibacterium peregrinum TaxID=43304 RepID=A0A1A0R068_MYCPR|nr:hypothetical protein A5792_25555 [Mycolicibacterium peregrinum]